MDGNFVYIYIRSYRFDDDIYVIDVASGLVAPMLTIL